MSCLPTRGRSETERDFGTSANCGTYCDMRRTKNEPFCDEEEDTEQSLSER